MVDVKKATKKDSFLNNIAQLKNLLQKLKQLRSTIGIGSSVSNPPISGGRTSGGSSSPTNARGSGQSQISPSNQEQNIIIKNILAEISQIYKNIESLLEDNELVDQIGNELDKQLVQIANLQNEINEELTKTSIASVEKSNPNLFSDYLSSSAELKSKIREFAPVKQPFEQIDIVGSSSANYLTDILFSPNGTLYARSQNNIWKLENGEFVSVIRASQVCSIAFDPSGVLYASMHILDQKSEMWKMDENQKFIPVEKNVEVSPCYRGLAVGKNEKIYASNIRSSASNGIAILGNNDWPQEVNMDAGQLPELVLSQDGILYAISITRDIWKIERTGVAKKIPIDQTSMFITDSIAVDKKGALYVSGYSRKTQRAILLKKEPGKDFVEVTGLPSLKFIWSIAIDPSSNSVFILGPENENTDVARLFKLN